MCALSVPSLPPDATADAAAKWVGDAVFTIGLGFHPDTRAADYIGLDSGAPSFDQAAGQRLDASLDKAFELLGESVYEHGCWYAWRLYHGLPMESVQDARWHLLAALQLLDPAGEYSDEDAFKNAREPMTLQDAHVFLVRLLDRPTT